jgi:hypothetical protein
MRRYDLRLRMVARNVEFWIVIGCAIAIVAMLLGWPA